MVEPSLLEHTVRRLAAIDRPSASPGEREAAEWIATRLREEGCEARLEEESAHGTYWWPLGLLSTVAAAAGLAALRGRRLSGGLLGSFASLALVDESSGGRYWFRRLLPQRPTWNVVAETGDQGAERTLVLLTHHDAAHSGLVFHPEPQRRLAERFPTLIERLNTSPPIHWPFVSSGGVVTSASACPRVPSLLRHTLKGALQILARDGCRVALAHTGHAKKPPSHVKSQSAEPGSALGAGDVLTVRLG